MILTEEQVYTPKELAEHYKLKEATIRKWIRLGKLKALRIGDNLRVTESAWKEFIEETKQPEEK